MFQENTDIDRAALKRRFCATAFTKRTWGSNQNPWWIYHYHPAIKHGAAWKIPNKFWQSMIFPAINPPFWWEFVSWPCLIARGFNGFFSAALMGLVTSTNAANTSAVYDMKSLFGFVQINGECVSLCVPVFRQSTVNLSRILDLPKSGMSTSQKRGVKCYELLMTSHDWWFQKLIGGPKREGLQDVSRNVHQVPSRQKSSNLAVLGTGTAKGFEKVPLCVGSG